MSIKVCLFDLDGTVLDTIHAITDFVNTTFAAFSLAPITEEECKIFVGDGARRLIVRALASKGVTDPGFVETILSAYNQAYNADPLRLTAPFEGILPLFRALRARGIRIGILSNKPESATVPLVRHFFGDLADITHGGREGVPLKPDPTVCFAMLNELGASPKETAYIGDTNVDMKTGKALGAALTIGVLWGFRSKEELISGGADVIVTDPCQILEQIDAFGKEDPSPGG